MHRILLVEDNPMNRDMLSRRLQRRGYEVLISEDGAAAVQEASAQLPDLILMDLSLPIMDGWQATRALRAQDTTRSIPIIALTAHAMAEDSIRAMEAGCNDFDTKPVDLERLLGKIQALVH